MGGRKGTTPDANRDDNMTIFDKIAAEKKAHKTAREAKTAFFAYKTAAGEKAMDDAIAAWKLLAAAARSAGAVCIAWTV